MSTRPPPLPGFLAPLSFPVVCLHLQPGGFPDGSVDYGTSTTFGVDCGCDEDATTTETPAPTATTRGGLTPSPTSTSAGDACAAGSGVFVTSSEFPEMEGCMVEIEILEENDEIEYITETGLAFIYATVPTDMTEVCRCLWQWGSFK